MGKPLPRNLLHPRPAQSRRPKFGVLRRGGTLDLAEGSRRSVVAEQLRGRYNLAILGPVSTGLSHSLIGLGITAVGSAQSSVLVHRRAVEALYAGLADNAVSKPPKGCCARTCSSSTKSDSSMMTPTPNCCSDWLPAPTNFARCHRLALVVRRRAMTTRCTSTPGRI